MSPFSASKRRRCPRRGGGWLALAGAVAVVASSAARTTPGGGGRLQAPHWAYVVPVRPALPNVADRPWPRNAVDRFILAKLEREHLKPSPPADRCVLIRRVSLDLTGLPPTLEEVDRFVNDPRPQAYEELVNRLLSSPAFGEHWARLWLDLARYADSAGYADDPPRTIWAFRDYVIRAFNSNLPFDRFTLEQIAGDLLPDSTEEDRVATAFHRNTMTNNEGGTDDEEFRNAAVVDRVNTTWSVWMGTTMACAQCHNHKYDPITQEEYFRFFAPGLTPDPASRGVPKPCRLENLRYGRPGGLRYLGQQAPALRPPHWVHVDSATLSTTSPQPSPVPGSCPGSSS